MAPSGTNWLDRASRRDAISQPRFRTFLEHSGGDEELAGHLYEWNLEVSAALMTPLAILEVTLRNRLHQVVSERFGPEWMLDRNFLQRVDRLSVDRALESLSRRHRMPTPDAMVSELSLGFWVGLLSSHHDQMLWRRAAHRAFHLGSKRRVLHAELQSIRLLRNRIAHHEHLLLRDLPADLARIDGVLESLVPAAASWARELSDAHAVIEQRPVPFGS